MKKSLFTALLFLALFATKSWAQSGAPEKISFQAVVRDASNALVTNHAVGMRISILQGSASGSAVYSETQTPTSNANGLVSIEIGGGNVVSGSISGITWAGNTYFIQTEVDPTGGTNYTITGASQLLSVPYALYAKTSGSSTPGPAGPAGPQGLQGPQGVAGVNGQGVPTGGTANQVLAKVDGTDYNTAWVTPSAGTPNPLSLPNAMIGRNTLQNQAILFASPFIRETTNNSPGAISSFIVPANTTITIRFYSYENEGVTYELFNVTPVSTGVTFTTAGSALGTCTTSPWSSGAPTTCIITYSATAGQLLTIGFRPSAGGNFLSTGATYTQFSAN